MTYWCYLVCVESYIERLLDRISNGKLAEDRRNAISDLQLVVSETHSAQLAFGAMGTCHIFRTSYGFWSCPELHVLCIFAGFPVMLGVLKEDRDDTEMVTNFVLCFVFYLVLSVLFTLFKNPHCQVHYSIESLIM